MDKATKTESEDRPAFPLPHNSLQTGLTKRELFAAFALAGMLAKNEWYTTDGHEKRAAINAYRLADAMMEEDKK